MEQKTNRKNSILLLGLIFFGLLFSFILIEILLKSYYLISEKMFFGLKPSRTTIKWRDDELVGKRLVPNQSGWFVTDSKEYFTWIDVNSGGWRESKHSLEKPEDIYRILVIGDSFVENFQVPLEQTFFKQLEKGFNNIEVVAMGLGDSGTAQQYILLKEFGLAYQPDLIIHFFFTGNDVKNNSLQLQGDPHRTYFTLEKEGLKLQPFKTRTSIPGNRVKSFLKNNIRTLELLLNIKDKILTSLSSPAGYPIDYHVYDKNYSQEYKKAWETTKRLILQSRTEAEDAGAEYILVSSANNEQVNQDVWESLKLEYPALQNADIDLEKPDKVLKEFCQEEDLNCLFMLPYFKDYRNKHSGETTHYLLDGHWNETGTDLVADFLVANLEDYFSIK